MTERRARQSWAALAAGTEDIGLRLHPDNTKLVRCKDSGLPGLAVVRRSALFLQVSAASV
ncbi:hypothetical protein [Streptomyces sp. NBC_00316]|uniref:hypothetical protein n=1 Tax=Streptomyces sp. NBC_00316 TaxID=2975710 RepID=UPI002E2B3967|nr:hypothetical protein [Streptomyces sp. NBC_00316]